MRQSFINELMDTFNHSKQQQECRNQQRNPPLSDCPDGCEWGRSSALIHGVANLPLQEGGPVHGKRGCLHGGQEDYWQSTCHQQKPKGKGSLMKTQSLTSPTKVLFVPATLKWGEGKIAQAQAFINSGAAGNCIDQTLAHKLGLSIAPQFHFSIWQEIIESGPHPSTDQSGHLPNQSSFWAANVLCHTNPS